MLFTAGIAFAAILRNFGVICAAFLVGAIAGGYSAPAFGNRALWCDVVLFVLIAFRVRYRLCLRYLQADPT